MGLRLPIVLTVLILAAAPARGAPESALWERWVAQDPDSAVPVDHGSWDRFLAAYVVADGGVNRVAYQGDARGPSPAGRAAPVLDQSVQRAHREGGARP